MPPATSRVLPHPTWTWAAIALRSSLVTLSKVTSTAQVRNLSHLCPFLTTPLICITEICVCAGKKSRRQTPWNIEMDDVSVLLKTHFYKPLFSLAFTCLQAKIAGPVSWTILSITWAIDKKGRQVQNITEGRSINLEVTTQPQKKGTQNPKQPPKNPPKPNQTKPIHHNTEVADMQFHVLIFLNTVESSWNCCLSETVPGACGYMLRWKTSKENRHSFLLKFL